MRDTSLAFLVLLLTACSPEGETNAATNGMSDAATPEANALHAAIADAGRTAEASARDQYRHPKETLEFFGVQPDDAVVEIWPGGGWYTDILRPYLNDGGSLALVASERGLKGMRDKAAANEAAYENVLFSPMEKPGDEMAFPTGSADVVLTFRNVHNWAMGDEPYADEMFVAMFDMLRPGGTLGVVDHRLPEDRPDSAMKSSGYMKVSTIKALAEAAGFEFVSESEINANPKDTADHPSGVWTLPPTLALKDQDREKYAAIGESDRMTLKFRKPE